MLGLQWDFCFLVRPTWVDSTAFQRRASELFNFLDGIIERLVLSATELGLQRKANLVGNFGI